MSFSTVLRKYWREPLEFVAIFAFAGIVLGCHARFGSSAQQPLAVAITIWAALKTAYYFAETLRHLIDATAADLPYHRFLVLVSYNMSQITLSYAIDFYCLYRLNPDSLNGIDSSLTGWRLMFECFYFSVLNFAFFGYGDITPAHISTKIVMMLEVVTAFATVIFLLSDFVSMKESIRPRRSTK
jgi:hypothetical protein